MGETQLQSRTYIHKDTSLPSSWNKCNTVALAQRLSRILLCPQETLQCRGAAQDTPPLRPSGWGTNLPSTLPRAHGPSAPQTSARPRPMGREGAQQGPLELAPTEGVQAFGSSRHLLLHQPQRVFSERVLQGDEAAVPSPRPSEQQQQQGGCSYHGHGDSHRSTLWGEGQAVKGAARRAGARPRAASLPAPYRQRLHGSSRWADRATCALCPPPRPAPPRGPAQRAELGHSAGSYSAPRRGRAGMGPGPEHWTGRAGSKPRSSHSRRWNAFHQSGFPFEVCFVKLRHVESRVSRTQTLLTVRTAGPS